MNTKIFKKILAWVLCVALMSGVVQVAAFPSGEECVCDEKCLERGANPHCEFCFFEGIDRCEGRLFIPEYTGDGTIDAASAPVEKTELAKILMGALEKFNTITVILPQDAGEEMFAALRIALNMAQVPEGSVNLTVLGAVNVPEYAFDDCSALASISMPQAQTLGAFAFLCCSRLKTAFLPKVRSIEEYAFQVCTDLRSLTLGSLTSVVHLNYGIFHGVTTVNEIDLALACNQKEMALNGNNWELTANELDRNSKSFIGYTFRSITKKHIADVDTHKCIYCGVDTHTLTYTVSGNTLTEACRCGHTAKAILATPEKAYTYTGEFIMPARVSFEGDWLGDTGNGLNYYDNKNVGTATVKAELAGEQITTTFEIKAADIAGADIIFSPASGSYDGSEQSPAVSVVWNGKTLAEDGDYTLSWDKPGFVNAQAYTVTVTGKGNFEGAAQKTFGIGQKEIGFFWGPTQFMPYTGQLVLPEATATGLVDADTCKVLVSVVETEAGAGVKPGKWTARITGLSNSNYKLPENSNLLEVQYTIYANQAVPAVSGVAETIKGRNDGYITGLTTEMEYSTEYTNRNDAFTRVTDPDMRLAPGTYYVRYAAKDYYYASALAEVNIAQGRKPMVTYTDGDGSSYEKEFGYGEVITIPTNEIFKDTFRKGGYTLTGWQGYTPGMTMPANDLTFTAVYTPNQYTVRFDANGGEAIAPITVTYGEKYGSLPSSSITGLSGGNKNWYLVDANGVVTGTNVKNLTLVSTAREHTLFIKRNVLAPNVSIALRVPGGISDSYQYYIPGASQRVLTATVGNQNTDILDYTYQWYKDGTPIDGATASVLTLDGNVADAGTYKVEVTATLKSGAGIAVTTASATGSKEQNVKILHIANTLNYNANGGEGGPQSAYTGGVSLNVSQVAPTRELYTFAGWNTKPDGSGDTYTAADTFTFADDNGNGGCTVTLYAQWKLQEFTVTYKADGQVVSTQKVAYGKDAKLPAVPQKDGYTGVWDKDGKNITADTEITAVYTPIPGGETGGGESGEQKPGKPQTGDDFNPGLWIAVAALSVAALGALAVTGRKKKA